MAEILPFKSFSHSRFDAWLESPLYTFVPFRLLHKVVWGRMMWVAQSIHLKISLCVCCKACSWIEFIGSIRINTLSVKVHMSIKRKAPRNLTSEGHLLAPTYTPKRVYREVDANDMFRIFPLHNYQAPISAIIWYHKCSKNFWFCKSFSTHIKKILYICRCRQRVSQSINLLIL